MVMGAYKVLYSNHLTRKKCVCLSTENDHLMRKKRVCLSADNDHLALSVNKKQHHILTVASNHLPHGLLSFLCLRRVLRLRSLLRWHKLRAGVGAHRSGLPVLGGGGGRGVGAAGGVAVTEELQLAVEEDGDEGQVESCDPPLLRLQHN